MALPTCALAVKALAVSARAARSERGPAEDVQGEDRLGRTRVGFACLRQQSQARDCPQKVHSAAPRRDNPFGSHWWK